MAVQAQYPSNTFTRIQNNLIDELQLNDQLLGFNHLFFNSDTTVFSNPQSDLTCIANSGSKKRIREESDPIMNGFAYLKTIADPSIVSHQSRVLDSANTSTSGCCISQELAAQFYHQNAEISALIQLQNERLRAGMEQLQKRHCLALISTMEEKMVKKLKEKDIEIERAIRQNLELEEKVRQMSAENQIWFNGAKNNEAIVSSLRSSLEQFLFQSTAVNVKEGYGDSDGTAFPADDAKSCCYEGEEEKTNGAVKTTTAIRKCRVCCEKDVSVLLLPCRHLCLCKDCEPGVDTCPICHVSKKACLQILMS